MSCPRALGHPPPPNSGAADARLPGSVLLQVGGAAVFDVFDVFAEFAEFAVFGSCAACWRGLLARLA